jgi:hypothetical protein
MTDNPVCKCKKKEFCDICLENALNEMVERGYLKKVPVKGEWKYIDKEHYRRLDPEPKGISWSS